MVREREMKRKRRDKHTRDDVLMMRPCFTDTQHTTQPQEISSARLSKKKTQRKREERKGQTASERSNQ